MRIKPGVTNYYIYGVGLLYEIDVTASTTTTEFYHFDCRGSTVALTDGNGNLTDEIEYSPYGTTTYRAGSTDTPFCFNGQYGVQTDPNGLLYMRARHYNPYISRFINADPSDFAGGLNFYAFCNDNPINAEDPFGLGYWSDVGQVWVGYGQAVGGTVTGLYNVAAHPINTAVGLYNAASSPVQTFNAISTSVANTWNSGLQGQGQIVGNVLIAAATIGSGEAIASTRAAQIVAEEPSFGAFAANTAGMSQSELLSQWEIGSKALNLADYEALGGNGTSALFKAPYIGDWVDTAGNPLTSNPLELGVGGNLFMQGSGLTPQAYQYLGYGVPAASFIGNNITGFSSSTGK